jgi:hypothetical protein
LYRYIADVSRIIDESGDGSAFSVLVNDHAAGEIFEESMGGDEINLVGLYELNAVVP